MRDQTPNPEHANALEDPFGDKLRERDMILRRRSLLYVVQPDHDQKPEPERQEHSRNAIDELRRRLRER
jgi:hypothetical protein